VHGLPALNQEEMAMKRGILVVAGMILVMAGCAPQGGPTVDVAAETQALRDAADGYSAAVEALDGAAAANYYASHSVIMPPNGGTLVGPAAFQDFLAETAGLEGFAVELDDPDVVVGAGGDMGYTLGTVRITMPNPDGTTVVTNERDIHVWRKQADGSWKIVIDMWNSPDALPEMPE
jgi:ketosteroid isomerase-like protein